MKGKQFFTGAQIMQPVHRTPCLLLILGLLVAAFSACRPPEKAFTCTDKLGCVYIAPGQPIQLGVLQALQDQILPLGLTQLHGLELALEKYDNILLEHPISLQVEDTGCTAEGGANAALKIIADPQSVAIFGTTCSQAAMTASQVMSDAGLSMISGNNSAPHLTSVAGVAGRYRRPGYFRTAPNEEHAGEAAAAFAFNKLGIHKAATLHDGDIYSKGLVSSFSQTFSRLGGEIVLNAAINKGETEMEPVLTAVFQSEAELLFFPLFQPEATLILLQAKDNPNLHDLILMSDGALIEQSFIDAAGNDAVGLYFVGPRPPDGSKVERLTQLYIQKFGTMPAAGYYITAYDAVDMLLYAIRAIAVTSPDGGLHIGRQALRDMLHSITHYDAVSGLLTCDRFGDCGTSVFNILRLEDPSSGVIGLEQNVLYTYPEYL